MTDDLTKRRLAKATSYLEEFLADPSNRRVYEEESRAIASADVEEGGEISLPGTEHPPWWGSVQEAAQRSRAPCICGHAENQHCVPKGDEPRVCMPMSYYHYDWETGQEVLTDGGCSCQDFHNARNHRLGF